MAGLVDFQNEEEVQEYLTNVGTEYSYQCYKEKDPNGCHRLAEYFEGIKKNFNSAAQVLKANCEQNQHGESCYKLGGYYITGKGTNGGTTFLLMSFKACGDKQMD